MIHLVKGNILEADTEAVVNTVNTVGVMGKGIALQFKELFPENFLLYKKACEKNEVQIGKMFVTETKQLTNPKYIINFPTKAHWKQKSSYAIIEAGMEDLVRFLKEKQIHSVAIPPLGCGNGGLDWEKVRPIIENKLAVLNKLEVTLYEPNAIIAKVKTKEGSIALTQARAMVLDLIKQYSVLGYETTILEIQKLAYFLQRFGEPLRLQYKKHTYGPYAYNLQHLLTYLEGSYLDSDQSIPDSKPFDKIRLIEEKIQTVQDYIRKECSEEQINRLKTVHQLIEGFESPFGMELLSTVDWVLKNELPTDGSLEDIVQSVHKWNSRKKQIMQAEHIGIAYERLKEYSHKLY